MSRLHFQKGVYRKVMTGLVLKVYHQLKLIIFDNAKGNYDFAHRNVAWCICICVYGYLALEIRNFSTKNTTAAPIAQLDRRSWVRSQAMTCQDP